jgi:hypothetical protein
MKYEEVTVIDQFRILGFFFVYNPRVLYVNLWQLIYLFCCLHSFLLTFVYVEGRKKERIETIFFDPLWADILIVYLCILNSGEYTHKHVKYESSCSEHLLCIHPLIDRKNISNSLKQIMCPFSWLLQQKKMRIRQEKSFD